jgi:glutathione-regulated potassium-efflux system protein KefB
MERPVADLLAVAVTLSMAATPLLLALDELLAPKAEPVRAFDELPKKDGHVVIAGFGRVGQIIARILIAKRIPVTALDADPEQVDFIRKFGTRIYYGDASRPEILEAAQTGKAPSCSPSMISRRPCAPPAWCARTTLMCPSMPGPATAATSTS